MKFISKTLPDVFLSTLKTEFDAIAEDCSLLNVSVSGEYTLILTIDTDLVVTLACTNSSTFGSATSIAFNGTVLYTKSCAVGYNPVIRVLYSESFFFCYIKGVSYSMWWVFEKLEGDKFANCSINNEIGNNFDMKTMSNTTLSRVPLLNYSSSMIDTLDYVENTVLVSSTYKDVAHDANVYACSNLGFSDKVLTMNNRDYYILTQYRIVPIDSE